MKLKMFGLILAVIMFGAFLSGCGCFQEAAKGETAAPAPPPPKAAPPEAKKEVPVTPAPAPAAPAQTVAPTNPAPTVPVTTAPTYTLDQIAKAGASLVDAGKMEQLLALLAKYGVQAVTQLQPDQYGVFATELRTLGAQL